MRIGGKDYPVDIWVYYARRMDEAAKRGLTLRAHFAPFPRMTEAASAIYRNRDFDLFIASRFLSTVAMQVQSVAIGWQIYDIGASPFALGFVGLCQFAADVFADIAGGRNRGPFRSAPRARHRVRRCSGLCAGLFLLFSLLAPHNTMLFYACWFCSARRAGSPDRPEVAARLPGAAGEACAFHCLNSSVFTTAVIAGPALGGFLFAVRSDARPIASA